MPRNTPGAPDRPPNPSPRGGLALAGLLAFGLLTRLANLDQPVVENYVGRQVPTAMVARNLERGGGGFLTPTIDVAPLPNLFLVEPPIYAAAAVGLRRVSGLTLEASGRAVSALGVVLAAWGLFGLAARRGGRAEALGAVAAFLAFPVTVRYGRAFQPDALMLGCVVAGLRCWDGHERAGGGSPGRLVAGFILLATGLALKVTAAFVLVPLVGVVIKDRKPWKIVLAAATLAPAALWYAHAAGLIASGVGSRASADNGSIWLRVLVPSAWWRAETYRNVARFLGVRAFTPFGPALGALGFLVWPKDEGDRLWRVWGASALSALAVLAAKLHHEYYWLALAPVLGVGVARAIGGLWVFRASHQSSIPPDQGEAEGGLGSERDVTGEPPPLPPPGKGGVWLEGLVARRRVLAVATAAVGLGLSAALTASTWTTPPEWASLRAAAREVRLRVPAGDWVVAPEALLFEADRRGCRLELTPGAAARAAGEWGEPLGGEGPLALVGFYRRKGATYFADVRPRPGNSPGDDRLALHRAVRRRYNVLVDRPGVLIARLVGPENRPPVRQNSSSTDDSDKIR